MSRHKVNFAPPEIKEIVNNWLLTNNFSNYDALVALLSEHGYSISKTALWGFAQILKERTEKINTLTDAAAALLAKSQGNLNDASTLALVFAQTQILESLVEYPLDLTVIDDPVKRVQIQTSLIKSLPNLSSSLVTQDRWRQELRQKIDKQVKQIETEVKEGKINVDDAAFKYISERFYGIVDEETNN